MDKKIEELLDEELIERTFELDVQATPGPWYWGDGFDLRVGPCCADEDESGGSNKYLDCCLQSKDKDVIPIRVDHHEPIWDCDEYLSDPSPEDRNLIAEYRTLAVELAKRLKGLSTDALGAQGWVSVEERLPENRSTVLAFGFRGEYDKTGGYLVGHYINNDWITGLDGPIITHWMPLPPAPDGGEER